MLLLGFILSLVDGRAGGGRRVDQQRLLAPLLDLDEVCGEVGQLTQTKVNVNKMTNKIKLRK